MKRLLIILCLCTAAGKLLAAGDSSLPISLVRAYSHVVNNFTTDNMGNIYLVNTNNQVKKISERGDSIAVYNDVRRYGKISNVDASNPLKVLVYFKDFATIVVLDRLLNVRNTIDLRQQNILQVRAVTPSYDNNIWLFDELEGKVKKIDDNGRVILESVDFRQVFDAAPTPEAIFDRDGFLYLYDSKKGLYVFDYYAAQKSRHQVLGLRDLQVVDKNTVTGRDSTSIVVYKPATLQSYNFRSAIEQQDVVKMHFNNKKIYTLDRKGELRLYYVK